MTAEREPVIETINLTKRYANKTAVENLNLKIPPGSVFGLLGPNGAGKTTIILTLLGLSEPTEGAAFVSRYNSTFNPLEVKSITGYLPDNAGFYGDLTARENLSFTAALNGITGGQARGKIEQALHRVGLAHVIDKKAGEFSHGMRQRLGIAELLVKDPQVFILDEPTLGIDPEGTEQLLQLISELSRRDGRTVLLSSHLLYQVQKICDAVGILVDGKMIARGTIGELEAQMKGDKILLELGASPYDADLVKLCRETGGVVSVGEEAGVLLLECTEDIRESLVRNLFERGYVIQHLRLQGFSLDDIYRRYFQKGGYNEVETA